MHKEATNRSRGIPARYSRHAGIYAIAVSGTDVPALSRRRIHPRAGIISRTENAREKYLVSGARRGLSRVEKLRSEIKEDRTAGR